MMKAQQEVNETVDQILRKIVSKVKGVFGREGKARGPSKGASPVHTPREQALRELLEEARRARVVIRSDDEAQQLLDWAARAAGESPENYHAVTIGGDIFVRPQYAKNVRVLREELIHVSQQRAGMEMSRETIVQLEIQARLMMIRFRHKWSITNDETRDMISELRRLRETGRY